VLPDDTPEVLQKRVLAVEHELYPEALAKLAEEVAAKE
jgi:folate-dependent phosphoribosylglycinamide formyltransferase PurN